MTGRDVLLDTHTLLWWFDGSLPDVIVDAIQAAPNALVSAATIWEAEINAALGKLQLRQAELLLETLEAGFGILAITGPHAEHSARLPGHHRDPFDRMLAAQALDERYVLLSKDDIFDAYGVERLWG